MLIDIPSGWGMRKLGELSSFQNGAAFKPTEWSQTGKPIIRIQNLNGGNDFNYFDGEIDKKFGVSDGDLLFCWSGSRGTSFGPRYWHGPNGWLNQHIFSCHPAADISKEYLYFLLDQLTLQIEMQAHGGAGLVHIKKSELVKFEYAIPEVSEQDRIAEILTSVDDSIRATEAVIAQAERVKRGLMEDLLTGGLGSEAIARGEVPEGWQSGQFGDLAKIKNGFAFKSKDFTEDFVRSALVVRMSNFNNGPVEYDGCKRIPLDLIKNLDRFELKHGDILIAMSGATVGKLGSVVKPTEKVFLNQRVGCAVPQNNTDREFLWQLMRTEQFASKVFQAATGNAQPNISGGQIEKISTLLPPVDVQNRISTLLSSIDRQTAANAGCVEQLQRLKRGLMDDLLTGRVRTV